MRLLHIITSISDSGGSEKLMEELLPGLKREHFNVSCLVFNGFDSINRRHLEEEGIPVFELGSRPFYYNPLFLFKLIPYVRQYDIVHAHNTPAVLFTALASLFGKAKTVMTVHSTEGRLRRSWWGRVIDKWIYSRYNSIICCSKKAEQNLLKEYPFLKNTLTVNNGVNLNRFFEALPDEAVINSADRRIIMVARFRKEKNHIAVIDSLRYLPKCFHVFFVGDGDTKNSCILYANKSSFGDRVHFLGLRSDVASILKAANYIVLSSRFEGLSLSSIEGMAVGKPFIASDVDGLREVVGGAGLLFPEGNSRSLANIILELEMSPQKYEEIAASCLKRAKHYDISTMIDGYKKVYYDLNNR